MALIAALFYWMSNPLLYVPSFFLSFDDAKTWTQVVMLVTLPWIRLPRVPWPWLLFLGLCYLSQLWSISDPNTDLSNLVYMQVAAMAFIVAANCEALVVCWGLGLGGALVASLSIYAFEQQIPGAVNILSGRFSGIGTNENILAYTLMVSLAAALAAGPPRHLAARLVWIVTLGLNAYAIYRSQSGTGFLAALSVLIAASAVAAWPVVQSRSRRTLATATAAAAALLVAGLVAVTAVLDKDVLSVSGRAPFWRAAVEASLDTAPWLGSGWGAVWEHPWNSAQPNAVVQLIYAKAGYVLPHGHNFFVDVMPELGLVGVAVAVTMVGYAVFAVRRSGLRTGSDPAAGRLVLFVTVALMVNGVTEPMLTVPLGWWAFALVVGVSCQRVLAPSRPRGRHSRAAPPEEASTAMAEPR